MDNSSIASYGSVTFRVNNSTVASTDVPVVAISSGAPNNTYVLSVTEVASNYFEITIRNNTNSPRSKCFGYKFCGYKSC